MTKRILVCVLVLDNSEIKREVRIWFMTVRSVTTCEHIFFPPAVDTNHHVHTVRLVTIKSVYGVWSLWNMSKCKCDYELPHISHKFFYHFYISTSTFFSPKKKTLSPFFFLFLFYFNGWNNFKFQSIIIASIVISFLKYGIWSRDMKKIYNHPCSVPTILQMQLFLH